MPHCSAEGERGRRKITFITFLELTLSSCRALPSVARTFDGSLPQSSALNTILALEGNGVSGGHRRPHLASPRPPRSFFRRERTMGDNFFMEGKRVFAHHGTALRYNQTNAADALTGRSSTLLEDLSLIGKNHLGSPTALPCTCDGVTGARLRPR